MGKDTNAMSRIRRRMVAASEVIGEDDSIRPDEVVDDDKEMMEEKVALARYRRDVVRRTLRRFRKCRSASEVFSEFSREAAEVTVMEMQMAVNSSDRQRAADSILNRALGKPVDRVVSVGMQISAKTDEELDHDIRQLITELGFERRAGEIGKVALYDKDGEGGKSSELLCAEPRIEWVSGVPGKVYKVAGEGEAGDGGEPGGEDDDRDV